MTFTQEQEEHFTAVLIGLTKMRDDSIKDAHAVCNEGSKVLADTKKEIENLSKEQLANRMYEYCVADPYQLLILVVQMRMESFMAQYAKDNGLRR